METPIKIRSLPGIKRDGTRLASRNYVDGSWCRFERSLPKKIGGYKTIARDLPEIVYGINSYSQSGDLFVQLGSQANLRQLQLDGQNGVLVAPFDRTPAGLISTETNIWQFDSIFDVNANATVVVAHAGQNSFIASDQDQPIWYGDMVVGTDAPLIDSTMDPVSGGIVVVGNYLVSFGSSGYVGWTAENDVGGGTIDAGNFTQQKIVRGLPYRGGGVPAALLWSLDSLLLMTFNDPMTTLWDFDTLSSELSILSSRSVIEYDGVFYWIGVDRVMSFSGVVREVPNDLNIDFFFKNLNFAQRQKVYAYKVPRFGEIWWCFPMGDSEECDHAIVLNVKEGYWYDTPLPNGGRSDGLYAKVYFKPLMTGVVQGTIGYSLWQHETGVDEDDNGVIGAVQSYFETAEMSFVTADEEPVDASMRVARVEPDFVQAGSLQMTVRGRANARTSVVTSEVKTITEVAADAAEQTVPLKEVRRLMSFRFESNEAGGDYEMGETLAHVGPADGRITQ